MLTSRASRSAAPIHASGAQNTRNETFFQVVLDAIRSSQATRIVLENVPSLMSTGLDQWNRLIDELQGPLGSVCDYTVLNALDFGLPQHRNAQAALPRSSMLQKRGACGA